MQRQTQTKECLPVCSNVTTVIAVSIIIQIKCTHALISQHPQDPDEFKSTVKDGITDWMRRLKDKNIVDWMIIQVISQDSVRGSKPKIPIPRSSVFDKIKSDFGGKNSER